MQKVRILQVIGAMNRGGAESVVMNLMRNIDRDRFQFDFLVHEQGRCDYDDEIESLGGTIYRLPRYNVANGASYRAACRRLFADHPEIQVVHGHIASSSVIYLDEARRAGCATIAHSHNVQSDRPLRRFLYHQLVRGVVDIADEFLGCSLQAGIDRFGLAVAVSPRFQVMHNGIEPRLYACDDEAHRLAKRELGYPDVPLVGNVARLARQKNQVFLLEAFANVLGSHPDSRLLLVGKGELEGALRARAEELGIAGSVDFLGVRNDVPRILKALDVFVFPSLREGLGMALVEAQAASLPCIASSAVNRDAFILDSAQAVSLEEGPSAWSDLIAEALDSHAPRADVGDAIRVRGYDIVDVAKWMEGYYADAAARFCRR